MTAQWMGDGSAGNHCLKVMLMFISGRLMGCDGSVKCATGLSLVVTAAVHPRQHDGETARAISINWNPPPDGIPQ